MVHILFPKHEIQYYGALSIGVGGFSLISPCQKLKKKNREKVYLY